MGKGSKKNKGSRAGDQLDSSDTDSISSSSTVMSDFAPVSATEQVTSNDFVLDKLIDALYEKRGSTRENALVGLVDAFESFVLLPFIENKCATLSQLFINSIKKGSAKETILASRAIGLLSLTIGGGSSSHEIMEESLPELCRILAGSDQSKMPAVLDCLALVTFVGANDLDETEVALKAIWEVIHPKSGSNVGTVKKYRPPVVAAAITAWSFLLTTISTWRRNPENWKEHIMHLSTLLEADDRAVRMAAGEAIALFFELKLLDVRLAEESTAEKDPKYQLFIYMQGMKAKVTAQIDTLAGEAGGKGADKKNLNDQRELFQKIWDYIKDGWSPEETVKISSKLGILRVSSWMELIQLNFLRRFLGRGFLKHAQGNSLLHEIFNFGVDKTENLSNIAKKIYRSEEEKERALRLNKDRKIAQVDFHFIIIIILDILVLEGKFSNIILYFCVSHRQRNKVS
ncbi:Interferon-related developmental regulator family protein [Rhynchospora pubera]|uniref:Interferon-related developmental regulator family protein n=1 Tax=Rhynchospora pubera TaxID=906938 RepID=A0AAV8HD38_9POAL|nr:Interferon-related developmental regulator family protein [Rhynchospora pubera]